MAEAFGVAAGVVGCVSLVVDITSTVKALREIQRNADGAPKELEAVIADLEALRRVATDVQQYSQTAGSDDFMLQQCQTICDGVASEIKGFKNDLNSIVKSHGPQKLMQAFRLRHWKDDVGKVQRSIHDAKANLDLAIGSRALRNSNVIRVNTETMRSDSEAALGISRILQTDASIIRNNTKHLIANTEATLGVSNTIRADAEITRNHTENLKSTVDSLRSEADDLQRDLVTRYDTVVALLQIKV